MRLLTTRDQHQSCPLCREQINHLSNVACGGCETRYHQVCWQEFTGCSTLGCASSTFRLELVVPESPRTHLKRLTGLTCAAIRARWCALRELLGFQGPIEDLVGFSLPLAFLALVLIGCLGYLVAEGGSEIVLAFALAGGAFLLFPLLGQSFLTRIFRGE